MPQPPALQTNEGTFTLFFIVSIFFTGETEMILTGFSSFSLTPVSDASELCSLVEKQANKGLSFTLLHHFYLTFIAKDINHCL